MKSHFGLPAAYAINSGKCWLDISWTYTLIRMFTVLLSVIEMEVINSCQDRNGGCAHLCTYTSAGIICSCFSGYLLDRDGRGCVGKCRQLQLLLKLVCMVRPVLIYMYLLLSRLDG